ncbi:MAG: type VI secretion system tip protein VgrG [Gammaproteobacteria bacterium]|nr:type VI secretion system tip protein VgrG [Gammaproteobacteria bacterium]MDH5802714.1 type VI secretion system tip protein VgrG [Gammaproteobacteria bacterium]
MPLRGSLGISTPLGDDVLQLYSLNGTETLGRLFQYELELLSKDDNIDLDKILAQRVTIKVTLLDNSTRHIDGYVCEFSQTGNRGNYSAYRAVIRPWLWFLTRTSDCRIFQEMKVPDIIKQVFRDLGYSDFEDTLSGNYRKWDYCVQYRESDYNFISRLMEQEGIYYYFKHTEGKHTLVLSDSISSHQTFSGYEEIPYFPPQERANRERDHIDGWMLTREVHPGIVALNAYDFEKPKVDLAAKSSIIRSHDVADYEIYDYPGEYIEHSDGDNYAQIRVQELQAKFEKSTATANARGVATGSLFKLTQFTRADQNREYLIISTQYEMRAAGFESGGSVSEEDTFQCTFKAMDSHTQFRSPRITPKPVVQGPQTAVVVGKAGEEIWTDKYGRVKVQFHWDRYGKSDENSSCWVRVAQVWAGKRWGAMHIPRMGQEVIVDFLEGDPDRPIITGRVYNADNMPPYDLPANKTQSGVKSRSSKSGTDANFNEIRFEDLKGKEQLYIHAEKDQDNIVENNETTDVGKDRTEKVGNNEKITIGKNKTDDVGTDYSIKVGKNTVIDSGDSIVFKTGSASIIMKKDGKIQIKGSDILIKASGNIKLKGSKISEN